MADTTPPGPSGRPPSETVHEPVHDASAPASAPKASRAGRNLPAAIGSGVGLGGAIVAETSLSFLGLGAPVTTPSWGEMLSNQARRFMTVAPWLGVFPGLAITLVVLSVNLLGDALRDLLDPRLRV